MCDVRTARNVSRPSPTRITTSPCCGGRFFLSGCGLFSLLLPPPPQVRPGHHGVLARWASLPSGVRYRSRQKGESLSRPPSSPPLGTAAPYIPSETRRSRVCVRTYIRDNNEAAFTPTHAPTRFGDPCQIVKSEGCTTTVPQHVEAQRDQK